MITRALLAAAAIIAVPIAMVGAAEPAAKEPDKADAPTCGVSRPVGSRLGGVRRCRSKAEREAHKQEAKQTVDRIQALKPTFCVPPRC